MSTIAIVGGNGKIARLLHPALLDRGHTPVALVRSEEQRADLEALGAQVRLLDIENSDVDDFVRAFEGCDAVVFTAGGGPDGNIERKRTVDLEGSLKSIQAAQRAGISRFVQVSAISVDDPLPEDIQPVWRAYVEAKRDADAALRDTDLAWTILRPGRLTDDPGEHEVALGPDVERDEVPRADVAELLATIVDDPRTHGRQWNLVAGETPIEEAVSALVGG